jgi:ElaB/YqjD/DUF883 family membrane-anchored ribosome-binding protein
MKRSTLATLVLGAALLGVSACSSPSKQKKAVRQVDSFLDRIETIHVESEISSERAHSALETLHLIVSPEFSGDSLAAYEDFVDAIEASEDQAEELRSQVGPLEKSADKVFGQWAEDLDGFTSDAMRRRSEARLETTRARYTEILGAMDEAQGAYDRFNLGLRDHAFFLSHDLNPSAVAEIMDEVDALGAEADALDRQLEACREAVRAYVQASSMARPVPSTSESAFRAEG